MTTIQPRRNAEAPRHPAALHRSPIARPGPRRDGYGFRPLYTPMVCRCLHCSNEFTWTIAQQVYRFEQMKLPGERPPSYCRDCSRSRRLRRRMLSEYDTLVGAALGTGDTAMKSRVLGIISDLCDSGYTPPGRMLHTCSVLQTRLKFSARRGHTPRGPEAATRNHRPLI